MARQAIFTATRSLKAACILGTMLVVGGVSYAVENGGPAAAPAPSPVATPAVNAPAVAMPAAGTPGNGAKTHPPAGSKSTGVKQQQGPSRPLWTDLTPAQQQALAPLAAEWDRLEPFRKKKWLALGNKFATMKPDEQQRMQERMREWVKLTPEQRRIARESYARTKKLNPDQKSAQWEEYQQLPDEQKRKLAADAAARKHIATLPSASQVKTKTVPPIKSTPKPVLEQSLTPQAANQPAAQPSSPASGK